MRAQVFVYLAADTADCGVNLHHRRKSQNQSKLARTCGVVGCNKKSLKHIAITVGKGWQNILY